MIICLDTACNAFWDFKVRSADPRHDAMQPHLLNLSLMAWNSDFTAERIAEGGFSHQHGAMVRLPEGVHVTDEAADYHGITNDLAEQHKLDLREALTTVPGDYMPFSVEELLNRRAILIVAHNAAYHRRVVELSFRRAGLELRSSVVWFCTRTTTANVVKTKQQKNGGWAPSSLDEAFRFFKPNLPRDPIKHYPTPRHPAWAVATVYLGLKAAGGGA